MAAPDFGCYVHAGSSVVTDVPLWWGMLTMGETVHGEGGRGHRKSLYLPLI